MFTFYKPDPLTSASQVLTERDYIDLNLRTHMKDEGEATLYNQVVD